MAIDVNSNKYTFAFAAVMVILVASLLAFASESLKDKQKANVQIEKMQNILASVGHTPSVEEAAATFSAKVKRQIVLNGNGLEETASDRKAFDIDVQKDYRGGLSKTYAQFRKGTAEWEWDGLRAALTGGGAAYPLYEVETAKGETAYVVPMVGTGLWGPIWGYVAVGPDGTTVVGASFDHKTETPGLGAEINQPFFQDPFIGKQLLNESGAFVGISVVKGGAKGSIHGVDAISGGTITSNGVTEMLQRTLQIYAPFFAALKQASPADEEVLEEEVLEEEVDEEVEG